MLVEMPRAITIKSCNQHGKSGAFANNSNRIRDGQYSICGVRHAGTGFETWTHLGARVLCFLKNCTSVGTSVGR